MHRRWSLLPGLCVSLAPRHCGTSFALRGPRRYPCTDEKTAALQWPLSSSRDSPEGQSGFSRPVQPRPGSLLPGSLLCPSCESHTVGSRKGRERWTLGAPGGRAGGRRFPLSGPVWPPPGQRPAPLPEAWAQRMRQEGPCLMGASLMPTGGLQSWFCEEDPRSDVLEP